MGVERCHLLTSLLTTRIFLRWRLGFWGSRVSSALIRFLTRSVACRDNRQCGGLGTWLHWLNACLSMPGLHNIKPSMVVHVCNPGTQEAQVRSSTPASKWNKAKTEPPNTSPCWVGFFNPEHISGETLAPSSLCSDSTFSFACPP